MKRLRAQNEIPAASGISREYNTPEYRSIRNLDHIKHSRFISESEKENSPYSFERLPHVLEGFSEQEWRAGILERSKYGSGTYDDEEFMLVMPKDDGIPEFGLVIPRNERPIVACIYVRIESKKEGRHWMLNGMQLAPGCMRYRSLYNYPVRVLIRQTKRQDWLRSIFHTMMRWPTAEATGVLCYNLAISHSFVLSKRRFNVPHGARFRNLAISYLLPFWNAKEISQGERNAHLWQLGFRTKLTGQNLGTVVNRLGLKIVQS
jgi:hypothetical protein